MSKSPFETRDDALELLKEQHGDNHRKPAHPPHSLSRFRRPNAPHHTALLSSLLLQPQPLQNMPDGGWKSASVMHRNFKRQSDFYKAGNPSALAPINPPEHRSAQDQELDGDLIAMGITRPTPPPPPLPLAVDAPATPGRAAPPPQTHC